LPFCAWCGIHLVGFKAAITRVVNDYARSSIVSNFKKFTLKDDEDNLSGSDVREGLTAVVSVKLINPQFEGQTKTKLGNSEVRGVVSSIATESLNSFFNENPEITKKILSKSISALRAREAAQKEGDEMGGSIPGALSLAKVFIMALDINF